MNIRAVDEGVYKVWKQVAKLEFINPVNQAKEKAKFFSSSQYNPQFKYKPLNFNGTLLKEKLSKFNSRLKGEKHIMAVLLREKITSLIVWIQLLEAVGSVSFTKYSVAYYGKPSSVLVRKAKSLVRLKDSSKEERWLTAEQVTVVLSKKAKAMGLDWKVKVKPNLGARADDVAAERTLYLKKGEVFSKKDVKRLTVHELGVHATRAFNGWKQPYRLFFMGTANYISTEEGLAAWMEQKKGVMEKKTLKSYAGRVIAIDLALKKSFRGVYNSLAKYVSAEEAYQLTLRAKRGLADTSKPGGLTKDYIYLFGLERVKKLKDVKPLFMGRIDINDVPLFKHIQNRLR